MSYKIIDFENWERKENFSYFTQDMPCQINICANIDITDVLKEAKNLGFRCYPLFTYMVSRIVNSHDEFKISIDENNNIIVWDTVNIRYPIFHDEDKRISILWSEYSESFSQLYDNFINDCKNYGEIRSLAAKGEYPENCFDMTSIPWVSFTNFSCPTDNSGKLFLPFVVIGKFFNQGEKLLLPVSLTVHHAACDGFHVGRFFEELQNLACNFNEWLL